MLVTIQQLLDENYSTNNALSETVKQNCDQVKVKIKPVKKKKK